MDNFTCIILRAYNILNDILCNNWQHWYVYIVACISSYVTKQLLRFSMFHGSRNCFVDAAFSGL
jgi:hypothetical protein